MAPDPPRRPEADPAAVAERRQGGGAAVHPRPRPAHPRHPPRPPPDPDGVRNRTGIPPYLLRDIEAGDLPPSALQLHRLASVFAVPLPLLVDAKVTPLRVLRLLSGHAA